MNLSVVEENGKWMIVDNYRYIETGGTNGKFSCDSPMRGRYTFTRCWRKERDQWANTWHFARDFGSREAAEQYLQENRAMMCNAPDSF